jgi:hypothetical protein
MGIIKDASKSIYTSVVLKPLANYLGEIAKADNGASNSGMQAVLRDRLPFSNPYPGGRSKPGSTNGIDFATLRRFSVQYDVARAAINRRKRQLNALEWDIVAAESDDKADYSGQIKPLKKDFKSIGGYKVRFRELIDTLVDDLLVLDAMVLYKRPNMGGGLYALEPVDAATIVLELDDNGGTPMPPDAAYRQIIHGKEVATFTADEMYYEMMNSRTYTPYGLAPLESLVLGVSAALKSDIYNVHLLTEGNIPEGFFGVPEAWTPDQIKEFQALWDAALSGDTRAMSKLKFVPSGKGATGYTPAVKPEDMRYKELQEWLMKKTCMLFEIQPNELGFTESVNKSTGEVQQDIGFNSGLLPLAHFFEEIFTDVIQNDMGFENLAFKYTGLDQTDERAEAEKNEILIRSGQTTIDEVRQDQGKQPLGVDKPFVLGNPTFIDADSQKARAEAAKALATLASDGGGDNGAEDSTPEEDRKDPENGDVPAEQKQKSAEQNHIQLVTELRAFRKYAVNRKKDGKALRAFKSDVLPQNVVDEMNTKLSKAADADAVRSIFKDYMADYQVQFLAEVTNLRKSLSRVV